MTTEKSLLTIDGETALQLAAKMAEMEGELLTAQNEMRAVTMFNNVMSAAHVQRLLTATRGGVPLLLTEAPRIKVTARADGLEMTPVAFEWSAEAFQHLQWARAALGRAITRVEDELGPAPKKLRWPGAVRHTPGPYTDFLQLCTRCGAILADNRNVSWPVGARPPGGWAEGTDIVQVGESFWTVASSWNEPASVCTPGGNNAPSAS